MGDPELSPEDFARAAFEHGDVPPNWADPLFASAQATCDWSGHDWADAGGDVQICTFCQAERWKPDA